MHRTSETRKFSISHYNIGGATKLGRQVKRTASLDLRVRYNFRSFALSTATPTPIPTASLLSPQPYPTHTLHVFVQTSQMYSVDRLNRQYEKLRGAVEEPENVGPLESSVKSLQKEIAGVSHSLAHTMLNNNSGPTSHRGFFVLVYWLIPLTVRAGKQVFHPCLPLLESTFFKLEVN